MFSPSVRVPVKNFLSKLKILTLMTVKYVPEWFPGAGFKAFARIAKENIDRSATLPFQHVKESFEVREFHLLSPVRVFY